MPDAYVPKNQNSMEMIRHHYKRVQCNVREMVRDFIPAGGNKVASLLKYASTVKSTNGYEVCAWS